MSHRKVYSQGTIPFSWENSPGVSKFACQDNHINKSSGGKIFTPSECDELPKTTLGEELKIPPPPPYTMQLPPRSASGKVFRWQEDPFVVAYKECTKSAKTAKLSGETRKGLQFGMRKSKSIFSCKNSCDIREDSYVRLSSLPPLPRDRARTFR